MKGKLLLSKCTKLKCLKLQKNCIDDTTLDLSESICLRYVRLKNVTMKGNLLLSRCTRLKCLKLIDCTLTDATLDLSESICLKYVHLKNVIMKGKLLLSKCTHLMRLKWDGFTINDATLDLSESSCLKLFLWSKVTQRGSTRLSNCTQSKQLMAVKCSLGNFTMDLSMSTSQIKQIDHDESQCKQIQILSMKNAHLGDALLSLDSVNDLNVLSVDNVTMSKECKEVFCNSLSLCKQPYRLSVKNVDLCDALLSLASVEYLNELNLVNVEMDKISKVLCKYLSKCTQLSRLSIRNVDLCDAPLSLDKMEKLYHLTIDNVTMCKNGYVMLCNSISTSKTVTSLLLNNLDMVEVPLSLDKTEKLHHLTIDNMTMCKNGYVMLCNSISACKTLTSLSVKNVDLCDALLNLDKTKKTLYHLTIDNVAMSKNGYVMLCNSMSTCTQLKHLKLKNLDLGDAKPSLDNVEELELINITMSLKCVDYIKSTVQLLKSPYFILPHRQSVSERRRKLSIEKSADSCERCTVNYTGKIVLLQDDNDYYHKDDYYYQYDDDDDYYYYYHKDDCYYPDDRGYRVKVTHCHHYEDDDEDCDFFCQNINILFNLLQQNTTIYILFT